nr:hypothetical protein [Tanacetum cinerariifolium]
MSATANTTPIVTTVTKAANKEKTPKEVDAAPKVNILDFCEEHYEDILSVIMDKIRRDKRKEVHARLDLGESPKKNRRVREDSQNPSLGTLPARANSGDRSHSRVHPRRQDSSPSRDRSRSRNRLRGIEESYGNTCSSYSRDRNRSRSIKRAKESKFSLSRVSESGTSGGGHWKSKSKRRKPTAPQRTRSKDHGRNDDGHHCLHTRRNSRCFQKKVTHHGNPRTSPSGMFRSEDLTSEGDRRFACYRSRNWRAHDPPHVCRQGSLAKILYEHCFNRLRLKIKSQMVPTTTSLTGFSGETIRPLGQLRLLVIIGDAQHSTQAWMNFMIVRSLSPYNGNIGRPKIREIQAVPSTAHGMLKFPVDGGIVTIHSTIFIPIEYATVTMVSKEAEPSDMTEVPRSVAKHQLSIREGYPPVRQKKRGQDPERARAIQVEVQKLVETGIMKEVYYHDWLSNLVMVKSMTVDRGCRWQNQMKRKWLSHTSHGVYCYTKMSFGLKNAGATYQRLVDKAFNSQVGQNIEVYVDDLVIKSHTKTEMLRDIDETFCTSLNGKLASLNRFLSKSAKKSLPLFKTLKKCIKKSDFNWTLEQPIPPAPVGQQVAPEILAAHNAWIKGSKQIARLELKTLFAQQAEHELLQTTRDFHSCKQEEGQSVSSYVLKMKGYIDNLERLGHPVTLGLGKVNKHKKPQPQMAARGQNHGKVKNKLAYAPKPKIPPPPKREDSAKDSVYHECGETGH